MFGNFTELDCADTSLSFSGITATQSDEDFVCEAINATPGSPDNDYIISGATTLPPGNYDLTGATIPGGSCTVAIDSTYSCQVTSSATSLTAALSFTASNGYWCTADTTDAVMDNTTGTALFTNLAPGSYTFDLTLIKKNTCNL